MSTITNLWFLCGTKEDHIIVDGSTGKFWRYQNGEHTEMPTRKSGDHKHLYIYLPRPFPSGWAHVLAMRAYRKPKNGGYLIRHLNDVATDNRYENLEWGTNSQNELDTTRNGRRRPPGEKITHKKVVILPIPADDSKKNAERKAAALAKARAPAQDSRSS